MNFVSSRSAIQEVAAAGKALPTAQEKIPKRAFSSADNDRSGTISFAELKEVLEGGGC
jgi:Ca2+-binding EF-hand superfamily protein